jgi:hypothetical protein
MAATIVVQEITGAAGSMTFTTITNRVRLFTADQATSQSTAQITYPVPIPTSGYNYSYWKHVCLDISGSFTKVDNIRHYSDGAIGWHYGSGGCLYMGNLDSGQVGCGVDENNSHTNNYVQATGTAGTTGDNLANNHTFYSGQTTKTVNLSLTNAASPANVDFTGETTAGKSLAIALQVKVDTAANGATSGVQTAETMTWKYDVID